MTTTEPTRAACLTPPSPGGVAVIQVTGPNAIELTERLLRSRRALNLAEMPDRDLRLCQFMDGEKVLDDAIVAVRRVPGAGIVELSLHGGPRVVQRALLRLKAAGAEIVEPLAVLHQSLPTSSIVEQELLAALLRAKTRAVAAWLMRVARELPPCVHKTIEDLKASRLDTVVRTLEMLCEDERRSGYLLNGIRVVIAGAPNVGKSTLANALAEMEGAIVSDVPGTTRDYVEHAGAAEGVPLTLVDTAGLRETRDVLESESIRRTREQLNSADLVLWLIDGTSELDEAQVGEIQTLLRGENASPKSPGIRIPGPAPGIPPRVPVLVVLNKSDQGLAHGAVELLRSHPVCVLSISARTGDNLPEVRTRIVNSVGLRGWQDSLLAPFTTRQTEICRRALEALSPRQTNIAFATAALAGFGVDCGDSLPLG